MLWISKKTVYRTCLYARNTAGCSNEAIEFFECSQGMKLLGAVTCHRQKSKLTSMVFSFRNGTHSDKSISSKSKAY